jgi:hypothetical protein
VWIYSEEKKIDMSVFDNAFRVASCESRYTPRAPGPHVGAIVRDIAIRSRLLKADDPDEAPLTLERRKLRMSRGFAWEWLVAHQNPLMIHQPGELIRDGIAMNPDGVTLMGDIELPREVRERGPSVAMVEECKDTELSSNRDLRSKWIWTAQGKAYCYGLGTNWIRYHVCYSRGDYRGSGPIYRVWWVEFTPQEIKVNWDLIRRNANAA